jgi:hypothetical protein
MFVTFLFETIYTSLHFGKVLKHWIRSFRDLTTGVQLEDRYFEEHAN